MCVGEKNAATNEDNSNDEKDNQQRKPHHKPLPEKHFELRNSLLTDLCENNLHIKSVYHIFVATLICLFVNTVAHDYFRKGEIKLGIHLIYLSFGKLHIAILFWLGTFAVTCLCYYLFNLWAKVRINNILPKAKYYKTWDLTGIFFLFAYDLLSLQIASLVVSRFQLPPATAAVVVLEQVRFMMKTHAFVRTNAEKVVKYKTHSDQDLKLPEISKYLYFLFAPTLIYRDDYPRTKNIRWSFVMYRLFEIAGVIFYHSFIFQRFVFPVYEDFGKRKFTWSEIIVGICENSIPGILIFVSGFYLLLHSVQNVFAELLCFGDRLFYKEWWTCTSYSDYFRTWNIIVHDWLYTYVYKDVYELVTRSKLIAKMAVFILSAAVHEWALTYILGFFFPALFIEFGFIGVLLSFIKAPKITTLNIIFWYGLIFGTGSLISLYSLEYFARANAPIESYTIKDYLVPRWCTCDCIE